MNKTIKVLVVSAVLFVAGLASVSAIGIGVRGNYWDAKYGSSGASLLLSFTESAEDIGPHIGIDLGIGKDDFYAGFTADWHFYQLNIAGPLNFYVGGGILGSIRLGGDLALTAGLRIPFGLDVLLGPLDIFLEFAPHIALYVDDGMGLGGDFWRAALGARFWF